MIRRHQNILIIFLGFIMLIAIAIGMLQYSKSISTRLETSTVSVMQEMMLQQKATWDAELSKQTTLLESIAHTAVLFGNDETDISNFIYSQENVHNFENLIIVGEDGIGFTSDFDILRFAGYQFFQLILDGSSIITDPMLLPKQHVNGIVIGVPIYENGVIVGAVLAQYSAEYLNQVLLPIFDNAATSYIINQNGQIIACNDQDVFANHDNLFSILANGQFDDDFSYRELTEQIWQGNDGGLHYDVEGEQYIAEFSHLDINNWSLFVTVPTAAIAESSTAIINGMTIFNIIVIIAFAVLIFVIFVLRNGSEKEIERIAYYDELTGIPNLTKFKMDIMQIIQKNPQQRFVIVKMDIINFKAINQLFDFEVGNRIIRTIADVGRTSVIPNFVQARIGPDEFLLFSEADFLGNLAEIRHEYEYRFRSRVTFAGSFNFAFRYGRYFIEQDERDVNEIINKVSMAHSAAKSAKVDTISDYNDKLRQKVLNATAINNKMEKALHNDEFLVYLQPKYKAADNSLGGAEALVRWREADGNMIYPNDFIPIFEHNHFIIQLDKYMLEKTCQILRSWLDKGYDIVPISINFSRLHLDNPNLISEIEYICDTYQVPRKYIEIEITESAILESEISLTGLFEQLHNSGFRISMDDFGSGYSSLGQLSSLDIDTIKLDRSFFISATDLAKGNLVVETVIDLAHKLGMTTVAEGVETLEQVQFLSKIGCEYIQGYYYARPMAIDDFNKHCFEQA